MKSKTIFACGMLAVSAMLFLNLMFFIRPLEAKATVTCNTGLALCSGAVGTEVGVLQEALNNQVSAQGYDLKVDCIYGNSTYDAVYEFQRENSIIPKDGIAGPDTLEALGIVGQVGSGTPPDGKSCKVPNTTANPVAEPATQNPASGMAATTAKCPEGLTDTNGICLPPNPFEGKSGVAGASTLMEVITIVLKALLFLGGIIAVIFIIVGGFWYMTSAGNEEQSEKGKKALIDAIIGLIVVLLAYVIVSVVTTSLTGGVANTTGQNSGAVNDLMR